MNSWILLIGGVALGRFAVSGWFPRRGGDVLKKRESLVWIRIYCTVPEGVRVTIELNTSIYTPAVCVRLSPLEVVAIVADPGALGCSCCKRSLLGDIKKVIHFRLYL